jgi:hypothetical protein
MARSLCPKRYVVLRIVGSRSAINPMFACGPFGMIAHTVENTFSLENTSLIIEKLIDGVKTCIPFP